MPSGRLASPTAGRRRPPEVNRTDITDFTKEKEKRSKKERENVLRRRCSKPGRGGLVRPLKPGTLLTQVGPVYSPMWVPFTRRLPFMLTSAGGQDIFVAKYNTCGDGSVDPGEECDGPDDAACPGLCRFDCTCGPGSIIPTVSEWTLIVMTLLGMTAGTVYIRRKPGPVGPTFQSVT